MRIRDYDEGPWGLSWVIDEPLQRTSHALAGGGRVWLIDPLDVPEAIERATALGEPAAVVQLLDRHGRDCAALAERLGVLHVNVPDVLPGSPFEVIPALRKPGWRESALWWPEQRALVVAEVVGTNAMYSPTEGEVGMHMFLRPFAPGVLRGREPEHLLVGHGMGVHGERATAGLEEAHRRARSDLPRVLMRVPSAFR